MDYTIRPYQRMDRSGLVQVIDAVCAEGMMRTRRFEPTSVWQHALEKPGCPCHLLLVASSDEQIVGWCRLFPAGENGRFELGIGVLYGHRSRGVGSALLASALAWADKREAEVVLSTRSDNFSATRVFKRHGFCATGRRNELLTMRRPPGPWSGERKR